VERDVTLMLGGEPFKVLLETIVSRENTLKVVEYFVGTGDMFDRIQWKKQSEIELPIDEELE
jgi:hypothetical protein